MRPMRISGSLSSFVNEIGGNGSNLVGAKSFPSANAVGLKLETIDNRASRAKKGRFGIDFNFSTRL